MKERFSAMGEVFLALIITLCLYTLALVNFPLFQSPHGILPGLMEDRVLTFSPLGLITASSVLFALAGSLLSEWSPTTSPRLLAGLWISIYLFFWVDPVSAFSEDTTSLLPVLAVLAGAVFLFLYFSLLSRLGPAGRPLYQAATWRSKFANGWIITWMGFFLGLSAVMVSAGSLFWMARLGLGAAAMVLAALNYAMVEHMQQAAGGEKAGMGTAWKWMLAAWTLLAVANVIARHVLDL